MKEAQDVTHQDFSGLHLAEMEGRVGFKGLFDNRLVYGSRFWYLQAADIISGARLGVTCFATLGGFVSGRVVRLSILVERVCT